MDFTLLDLIYVIIRLAIKLLFAHFPFLFFRSLYINACYNPNNSLSCCFSVEQCENRSQLKHSLTIIHRQCIVTESFQRELNVKRRQLRRTLQFLAVDLARMVINHIFSAEIHQSVLWLVCSRVHRTATTKIRNHCCQLRSQKSSSIAFSGNKPL